MKEILTGAKKIAGNVFNWLLDEGEIYYNTRETCRKEKINSLPRELDSNYYRFL